MAEQIFCLIFMFLSLGRCDRFNLAVKKTEKALQGFDLLLVILHTNCLVRSAGILLLEEKRMVK